MQSFWNLRRISSCSRFLQSVAQQRPLSVMAKRFNPGVVAKRGKIRVLHKRPASKKSLEYKKVKYVRGFRHVPPAGLRRDRAIWKRTLQELLCATDCQIQHLLEQDGLLPKWGGKLCPRCWKGKLRCGVFQGVRKYKCCSKACCSYILPHHLHPLFQMSKGKQTPNHCRSRQRCFFSSLQVHHHQIAASCWESTTRWLKECGVA